LEKLSFEPIIGCNHPIIASGPTPSAALAAHPIEKSQGENILYRMKIMIKPEETLSLYSNKYNSTIASGLLSSEALIVHPMIQNY
jgi:hypothetical protein